MAQPQTATVPVEEFLATFSEDVRLITERLRALIRAVYHRVVERAYPGWGSIRYMTTESFADRVVYLSPGRDYVNLGFQYARTLPDPLGLLTGTGENMRHIRISQDGNFDEAYYKSLIDSAFRQFLNWQEPVGSPPRRSPKLLARTRRDV